MGALKAYEIIKVSGNIFISCFLRFW